MKNKYLYLIIIGVISTVVGGLVLSEVEKLRNLIVKIFSPVWFIILFLWDALNSDYSLNGWSIFIFGIFTIGGFGIVLMWFYLLLHPHTNPEYQNYTEDYIYGVKWRWSWNQGRISNLWCYCQICDAQLIYSEEFRHTHFICERCTYGQSAPQPTATVPGDRYYIVGAAEREIYRRIRTKDKEYLST